MTKKYALKEFGIDLPPENEWMVVMRLDLIFVDEEHAKCSLLIFCDSASARTLSEA